MKRDEYKEYLNHLIKRGSRFCEERRAFMIGVGSTLGLTVLGMLGYSKWEESSLRKRVDSVSNWYRDYQEKRKSEVADKAAVSKNDASGEHLPYDVDEPLASEAEYRDFLVSLELRYFSADEIIGPHRNYREGVRNHLPPRSLWKEIIPTLRLADELRHQLGVPVTVLSVFRSIEYNTAIGGASRSQHSRNKAIDLRFDCSSGTAFELAKKMRDEQKFTGGVGWYPTFIHVDTREYNATWGKV